MMTAASTDMGSDRTSPGTNSSMASTRTAAARPVSCDLAPAWSATAVRELLVLTGKPWKKPAATLAVPMATISWSVSTSVPRFDANPADTETVSPTATSVMPMAPPMSSGQVAELHGREGRHREALGQHAHDVHASRGQVEQGRQRRW